MPSFNPITNITGRNAFTLFEIRLDNDFLVFRGNEHESSGQMLKGTVVLCLPTALKVEDVHLRLLGTERLAWTDSKVTPTGISSQKVDKTNTIFSHRWEPFVGGGASKSTTLAAGNYEWPFELLLPGDTCESVEGLPEANIIYHLKATVARGKLAYDLHTKKRVRIIRTLESSALEFLHAMSVENIWPNKVEYSIVVPQKAVVFGSEIPLETRFTPLLKGLEIGDITCKLVEVHDIIVQSFQGHSIREYKKEKEVAQWTVAMSREEHWQDMIEDTGQEGWVMNTTLDLPRKLGKCMQDVNVHGIKIRHKLKMVVALKNPDGHISEVSN
ncbi:putative arrestin domain-containing protein [Phaeoacremonium minimum UCRPA7]|uniref:Putative arrestin domain-containing protein n=1 Tax=Phaeoacremonium minimum (strain UCR-PA7) TaxID=1286976 RepID=R8BQX4_PHAM7|nr:putative arrestin domain-containing protein [Phaeoacremonium minimum UCRPA7]EOO01778.1 putative arrestin domain-containing protein [Phaeoacremonium minimum UCRPA7]